MKNFNRTRKLLKCMPYKDLIEEHEELVKDLKSGNTKNQLAEQKEELEEYKKEQLKLKKGKK